MNNIIPIARRPLRYVIRCSGCRGEMEIAPAELDQRLALCPHCNLPNPTPIWALLSGRKPISG
ncbi:MAG: hypothetical protein IPP14_10345 [Planctomycetes bacterium]|nr:hypothetical protein [Planctomycetota bacterium]